MEKYRGKVKQVFVKELDKPEEFVHEGKTITSTHRHSLKMDDDNWYGFGSSDRDAFLAADPDDGGKYKVLGPGSEITVRYTLSDCGKFRNAKKSGITVDDLVVGEVFRPGKPDGDSKGNSGGGSFDLTGIKVGHAINAAMLLGNNDYKNPTAILKVAEQLHDVSAKVEAKYRELNPNMSARDIGAASGNAVLNACKLKNDVKDIYKTAMALLTILVPKLTAYVKGERTEESESTTEDESGPSKEEADDKKAAEDAKKAVEKKAKAEATKKKRAAAKAKKEAEEKAAAEAAAEAESTDEEDGFGGDDEDDLDADVDF